MSKINQTPLFDPHAAQYVLGSIMHQPDLLSVEDKYILNIDDFNSKIYEVIFSTIYNLANNGAEKITPANIDLYISNYPAQYQIFTEANGGNLTSLLYEMTEDFDIGQFNVYYNRLKKFTTLRELRNKGFDISDFYNPSFLNELEEEQKFDKLTVQQIIEAIRNKVQLIENHNVTRQESTGQYAVKGVRELLAELALNPEVGIPIEGKYVNYATRGCRKGKMYLYSAPSGGGKTRTMLGNACAIAFPHIVNGKVYMPDVLQPVLFIATEMQADEIQTLILSWISGVNEEKILLNTCTDDEKYLLNLAVNIMEKYEKNFIIESIPNPSIKGLKALITNYILHDGIEYIFYDYIFTSVGLIGEFHDSGLREDVVLMMLSNTLKEIAANYNVFVMSGTQLNGTWENKMVRNANMLRGAKSIADKIDVGMIGVRVPKEELDAIKPYCEQLNLPTPNIVIDVYKNRRGKLCDVKIFRKFDYGTCRTMDIVITHNTTYEPQTDVPELVCDYRMLDLKNYE